jgi:hypothetical protein
MRFICNPDKFSKKKKGSRRSQFQQVEYCMKEELLDNSLTVQLGDSAREQ